MALETLGLWDKLQQKFLKHDEVGFKTDMRKYLQNNLPKKCF